MALVASLALALLAIAITVLCRRLNAPLSSHRSPKDPKAWPIVGCQFEVNQHRGHLMDWLAGYFRPDHRTVKLTSITRSTFVTVDPANVEHVLKTNFGNYPKGREFHKRQADMLGDGIFNADGNMWKLQRKIVSHQLSAKKLRHVNYLIYKGNALELLKRLSMSASGGSVDIQGLILAMAFESIVELTIGVDVSSYVPDSSLINAFDIAQESTFRRYFCPWWKIQRFLGIGHEGRLKKQLGKLNSFLVKQVEVGKKKCELVYKETEGNIIKSSEKHIGMLNSFILHTTDVDGMADLASDKALRDLIMNLLVAGRDSIASSLSWFLYCMCIHQDKQEKVFQELLSVERKSQYCLNKSGSDQFHLFKEYASFLPYDDVYDGMPYLHAALTETLRLYPPVPWDGKEALKDDILPDGTQIKAGNQVAYFPYGMGRMTFLWGHDAQEFKPERWLDDDGKFHPQSPFKFTSFQAGPRMCIGKDVAYLQMKVTAALLLRFFHFNLVPNKFVAYKLMFVMSIKHGLQVRFTPR